MERLQGAADKTKSLGQYLEALVRNDQLLGSAQTLYTILYPRLRYSYYFDMKQKDVEKT